MLKQQNKQTNGASLHYSEVDICTAVDRRIAAIRAELREVGSKLDAERVFQLEALGYVVDLATGSILWEVAVDD